MAGPDFVLTDINALIHGSGERFSTVAGGFGQGKKEAA
jgi:hypothetical protein